MSLTTNKVSLLIDDLWLQELLTKMVEFAQPGEILQLLDKEEVEICGDCQKYQTEDGEVIMDVFKCYDNQDYCLNCCHCEDHDGEAWY